MKRKSIKVIITLVCLTFLVIALISGACAPQSSSTEKVLKVGMMHPATGPVADKGSPGSHGALDAIQYINEELGGAGGYKVEVSWRDSAYDPTRVVTIVKGFMDEGCLLFTTHSSKEMTSALEIANRAEFPGMATYTSTNLYHPPQHIYGQTPDYGDNWIAFTNFYLKNVWKKTDKPRMALHLLNNSTGYAARDAATAMAEKLGIEIVATEEHASTTTSEMESLIRIKAKNPDVLFISSTPSPTAIIIKNAKDIGLYPGMTIGCGGASFTRALIDIAGADVVEGVYGAFPTVTWDDDVPGLAKAAEYCKKNNPKDYGTMEYLTCWASSLICTEILKTAVNNVGYDILAKGDVEAWRAIETMGIQKLNNYDLGGIQKPINYTPGDNRLNQYIRLYVINGGKILPVSDWIECPNIKYDEFSWWGK